MCHQVSRLLLQEEFIKHAKAAGLLGSKKHRFAHADPETISPDIDIHSTMFHLSLSMLDMVIIHHLLSQPTPLQLIQIQLTLPLA